MILNLSLDFDPTTKKFKVLNVETEEVATSEPVRVPETDEPQLTLGASNYTLNPAAVKLLGVEPNARIGINYQPIGDKEFPVIGTEEAFGCSCGCKLSKSFTVIYRGKQNERLSRFGKVFTLTPLRNNEGIFVLMGDSEPEQVPDEIEVKEDMTSHVDIKEATSEITIGEATEELEPLTFDDDFSFDIDETVEEDTRISEDSLSFE